MEYRVWCYGGENWWPSNFAAWLGQKGSLPNTNKTKCRLHVQTWLANVLYWGQIMNTPLQLNFTVRTSWLTVEQNYSFIGTGPGSKGTEQKNSPTSMTQQTLFHTYWVILFESTWVKTWFTPLYNQSEKRNGFFTCEYNVSANHSAPTKSNRVFGSFVFSLKVLFWQLCQKVKTFRFLVWIISQENCQKKLNNGWRRNPSLSRFAEIR